MPGTEVFGDEERKEVNDVLETGALFRYNHEHLRKGHWKARELEARVRQFTGASFAHAVSSGSAAVSCALAAAGVGHGDQVIVPPFTYVATIEAVMMAGGLPVFAEIDETLCLSAEGIRKAINPKTKAVLLVHMCGAAAAMDEIEAVCSEHNLVLVEDAGQALGAFYKGKSVGLFGSSGAFSFDFFKIATCGEGGVFITRFVKTYKLADAYSDHGHEHIGANRGMEDHFILGFNYRISELHAAVGVAQMRKLKGVLTELKKSKRLIKKILEKIDGLTFRQIPDPKGDSATFLNFFLPDTITASQVIEQFQKNGIAHCNYWYTNMYHFINQWDHIKNLSAAAPLAIHHLGAPQDYKNLKLPKSQEVVGRLISLGIQANWSQEEAESQAEKMKVAILKVMNQN